MNNFFSIFSLFSILILVGHIRPNANNSIQGNIAIQDCPSQVKKGTGYNKDGTEIMHSDNPMGHPNRNVIVSLHPLSFEATLTPTRNATITQREQTFLPKVLPVTKGSKVHFLNEDEFFHNVQSFTHKAKFSIGRRAPGISYSRKINKVGVINLMCDIHSHMNAVILSLDTPYFTRVDKDGNFRIDNLPDGKYRIEIFHANCAKKTDTIEIKGGKLHSYNS